MKQKISIITVCYNSEDTIKETFDSILKQTFDNYEYLVIDGGSTDSTVTIIKSYEKKFGKRMKWISEKDNGIYDAMNKGIRLATGDIIGILNSDDYLYDESVFENINKFFDENTLGIYGDLFLLEDKNLNIPQRIIKAGSGSYKLGWMPPHPTVYLKKEVYEKIGNYSLNYKVAADYDMLIRIYKNKIKLKYINKLLVSMRPGGTSTNGIKGQIYSAKDAYHVLKDNKIFMPFTISIIKVFRGAFRAFKAKIFK